MSPNVKKRIPFVLFALLLALLMVACGGGGDEETPESDTTTETETQETADTTVDEPPTEEPEPTPEPTEVPPTATPEPTPEPTPDPTADFADLSSAEGGFSLKYPADWEASDLFGFAIIASEPALLDSADPGEDGALMIVFAGPNEEFEAEGDNPVDILTEGVDEMGLGDETTIVEGPDQITLNGYEAARVLVESVGDDGTPFTAVMYFVVGEETSALLLGATPNETAAEFLPVFEAIAGTIELTAPTVDSSNETLPTGDSDLLNLSQGFLLFDDVMNGTLTANEQSVWDFIGLSGETIDITVQPLDGQDIVLDVVDETGTSILESGPVDNSFETEAITGLEITQSGTYFIVITGFSPEDAGEYTLTFVESGSSTTSGSGEVPTAEGSVAYGQTVNGTVPTETGTSAFTFNGSAGDIISVVVEPDDELDVVIDVIDANGNSILYAGRDNYFGTEVVMIVLPETGTYSIVVDAFDDAVGGAYQLTLGGPDGTAVTATDELAETGEAHAFPFTATAGEIVAFAVVPDGDLDVVIKLFNDSGDAPEELFAFDRGFGNEAVGYRVEEDGNYFFEVSGFDADSTSDENAVGGGEGTGTYQAFVFATDLTIVELEFGDDVIGVFSQDDGIIEYTIDGFTDDVMTISLTTDETTDGVIQILDLDDNILAEVDDQLSDSTETLTYTFTQDQLVIIRVFDFFEASGPFQLTVELE